MFDTANKFFFGIKTLETIASNLLMKLNKKYVPFLDIFVKRCSTLTLFHDILPPEDDIHRPLQLNEIHLHHNNKINRIRPLT